MHVKIGSCITRILVQVIRKWLLRLWHALFGTVLHAWEFLRRICSSAERPLHFLKVQLSVPPGAPLTVSKKISFLMNLNDLPGMRLHLQDRIIFRTDTSEMRMLSL